MATPDSPPKRPRLSLQIKAISNGPSVRTSRTLAAAVNPRSPTSFNTLSNVYVTAIDRSTPVTSEPLTAVRVNGQSLQIQTCNASSASQVQTPYAGGSFPETPLTAQPLSPAVYSEIRFPSTMTATPPLSAGPIESADAARVFTFSSEDTTANRLAASATAATHMSPRTPRRRGTASNAGMARTAPYTHPRSLHSILRNSPLPQLAGRSPVSPRRQSLRLQEKAARRVGYNNPLTQTITTNKYTKSHIDLLCEEASPYSPSNPSTEDPEVVLDLTMAYTGDETRDGGQTPGPFEEMRRRMAGLAAASPLSSPSGIRKRKKKEKKRRWVWTIGLEDDEGDEVGGAVAAIRAAEAAAAGSRPVSGVAMGTNTQLLAATMGPSRPRAATAAAASASSLSSSVASRAAAESQHSVPRLCVDTMGVVGCGQQAPEDITPSIEWSDLSQAESVSETMDTDGDIDMSDISSVMSDRTGRGLTPADDIDLITPTLPTKSLHAISRLGSEDLSGLGHGVRKDTPIPADLITS